MKLNEIPTTINPLELGFIMAFLIPKLNSDKENGILYSICKKLELVFDEIEYDEPLGPIALESRDVLRNYNKKFEERFNI